MNFSKGGREKGDKHTGRGGAFKGAIDYYMHDKRPEGENGPWPTTTDRVGFIHMQNLPPIDPADAWKEMKFLANAAAHIREENARAAALGDGTDPEAAAKKARRYGGTDEPVYTFSLNWHEDDQPTPEHLLETAQEVLRELGLENHQAIIVQHTDTAQPHVHVCVNLISPDSGMVGSDQVKKDGKRRGLTNDEYVLDNWAAEYEIAQGIVRSDKRHEKHMERLAKLDPARHAALSKLPLKFPAVAPAEALPAQKEAEQPQGKRRRNHMRREEWLARKNGANDNSAKLEASKIKRQTAQAFRQQKQKQDSAYQRRRAEMDAAYHQFQKDKAAIYEAYKPQLARVWDRPRRGQLSAMQRVRATWADPAKALREYRDKEEWRKFGRRQSQERRAFNVRERTLSGRVANALRAASVTMEEGRQGRLAATWDLINSAPARRRAFEGQQERAKLALRERQNGRRKALSSPIHAKRAEELKKAAELYQQRKAAIDERHKQEAAQTRAERAALRLKSRNAWEQWRGTFGIKERTKYAFNEAAGRKSAAATPFNQVAAPEPTPEDANRTSGATGRGQTDTQAPANDDQTAEEAKAAAKGRAVADFAKAFQDTERSIDRGRERTRTPPKPSDPGQK